jgi:uncharacterized protein involved in exopolysaccharide biosynthesis
VTNAFEMAKIDAAQDAPQFTVLDEAIIPPRKLAPSGTKTCGGLAFAGLVIGALLAPAWGRRRRRREEAGATEPEEPPDS